MDFPTIHKKWQQYWRDNDVNKYNGLGKKPYFLLEMFPYPSGSTLHIGHFYMYSLPDTHARFMRMCGHDVFHPMGFDAFGLPAENHALKTGTHPRDNTIKNMEIMRRQFEELGGMYHWNTGKANILTTCFPDYYKWNQWLFLQLLKHGLAYQKEAPVNWCDKCKTVLANEQVLGNNSCERCDTVIERRNMKQWFIRITDYSEKLLVGLDTLDWPSKTKAMQKNWIGKSTGELVTFKSTVSDGFQVFTTRPDTITMVTFVVIAPEHPDVQKYITKENKTACDKYIKTAMSKSEVDRQCVEKTKTGVFTGSFVKNPVTGDDVPVWVADYVLYGHGTGAVMGVPAHDERDHEFATAFKIKIIEGDFYKKPVGKKTTTYRLRDWGIGRQRYWGTPIPIIYCDVHGTVPVPEKDLPIELPYIKDFKPKGSAPLASVPEFINTKCSICGKAATRECDTMDTFVCSSWYHLRYQYNDRADVPFEKNGMAVDTYVGGAEHSCGHLLYARFIHRFLYEKGFVKNPEPFKKLIHQGMVLGPDGQKMSKSKGNVIAPENYTQKYGSDILRLYMQFGFNFTDGGPWDEKTLQSVVKFIDRIERLILSLPKNLPGKISDKDKDLLYVEHNAIKSVRHDLENFSFNTAVARCMELLNAISDYSKKTDATPCVVNFATRTLVLLIAPMIPHIAEEFWQMLCEKPSVFNQSFPVANEKYLVKSTVEIAVQINSKIVGRIVVPSEATQDTVTKLCKDFTNGKNPSKVIYIPGRIINFIIAEAGK
ncbi:MAG: leucine--tRNA ligase [Firmicutes bacterium]|nr:leucine--tRNA ligase [Bacillota bacterium]